MSPAFMPTTPFWSRAISPASPWAYTPSLQASNMGSFCATRAASTPVKTSPEPPLAMPGLPVVFVNT